jgi:hypothetical protein
MYNNGFANTSNPTNYITGTNSRTSSSSSINSTTSIEDILKRGQSTKYDNTNLREATKLEAFIAIAMFVSMLGYFIWYFIDKFFII